MGGTNIAIVMPQMSDLRLEEQRSTLRGSVSREAMPTANRPFDKLNNQAVLYRCTIS